MKGLLQTGTDRLQQLRDLALVLMVSGLALLTRPTYIKDDAFISFRYARNLARHGALVFNPGERVEGITNFLWTSLLGALGAAGLDIPYTALVLSILLIFWMGFRTWQLAKSLTGRTFLAVPAWSLVALSSGFWGTMTNGLEAALFAALSLEIAYHYARQHTRWAFLFAGLAFFTRPEGLGLIVLLYAVVAYREGSFRAGWPGVALAGGMILALEAFRLLYYGALIPNSVQAKSLPFQIYLSSGLLKSVYDYTVAFTTANPHLLLAGVGSVFLWIRDRRGRDRETGLKAFTAGGLALAAAAAFINGGDWMPHHRLFIQYAPFFILAFLFLLQEKVLHRVVWAAVLIGLLLPLADSDPVLNVWRLVSFRRPVQEKYSGWNFVIVASDRLEPALAPEDKVAAEGIGYLSYRLEDTYIHDLLGLTDPYLARHGKPYVKYGKGDPDYSLGQVQPAVVVVHNATFITQARQRYLDRYRTYCFQDCGTPAGDLVMIRRDRVPDLGPAFEDWPVVALSTRHDP